MIHVTKVTTTNNIANNNLSVLLRQEVYDTLSDFSYHLHLLKFPCHPQPFLNEIQILLYNENYE